MSTTVTYKSNTLTTAENQTKILNTAGKYMEDDITIVDVTQGGSEVLVVDTPDSHGGTIREITVTDSVNLQGQKQVTISSSPQTITPDTGYDGFASVVVPKGWTNEDIAMRNYSGEITLEGTRIKGYAFANSTITGITGLNVTRLEASAFSHCANLVNVNLPKATASGDGDAVSNFEYCTSLESIILPKYHNMWNYMFRGCTKLKIVVMPALRQLARPNSFGSDTALEKVDIGGKNTSNPNSMAASWVSGCTSLDTFILRYSTQVTLSNISAFTNTPFAEGGTGGTLYVPSSLISSYESATNWSIILGYTNNQILPIEGSQYETHYADGTVIPAV